MFFRLAFAALGASLWSGLAMAETRLSLASDEWCPYSCAHEAPTGTGYMIDIARAVFEPDIAIDYILLNWTRAVEETKAGRYGGLVGSSRGREGFVFTRQPLGIAQNSFAVRTGETFEYRGVGSLKGKVLGAINKYSYTGEIDQYITANANNPAAVQLVSGDSALSSNLRKLVGGRVDLVIDDINVLKHQAAQLGISGTVSFVPGGPPDPVYIAFSAALPEAQAFADRLDAGLESLRASGKLNEILDRYKLIDWK